MVRKKMERPKIAFSGTSLRSKRAILKKKRESATVNIPRNPRNTSHRSQSRKAYRRASATPKALIGAISRNATLKGIEIVCILSPSRQVPMEQLPLPQALLAPFPPPP
ncbi:MAG: hypothetical protein ACK4G3_02235 [bacterium]